MNKFGEFLGKISAETNRYLQMDYFGGKSSKNKIRSRCHLLLPV